MNVQLVAQTWWSNINSGHICRSECSCLLRYNFPAIEFRMVYFGPCVFDYLCKLNLTCKQGSSGALNMTCLLAVGSCNPIFYARLKLNCVKTKVLFLFIMRCCGLYLVLKPWNFHTTQWKWSTSVAETLLFIVRLREFKFSLVSL